MAKSAIDRHTGKIVKGTRQEVSQMIFGEMDWYLDKENRPKREPEKGPRLTALEIFYKEGKLAAWKYLDERNKKSGTLTYTIEILESWIIEEENKKGYDKDEDGR